MKLGVVAAAVAALVVAAPASAERMTFSQSKLPTQSLGWDFYEPSVFAAGANGATKAIYFAAHSEAAYTTRAPGWVSNDGGATWAQLPGLLPQDPASPVAHGGGHVDGDEGIIVADHTGRAWQFDNGAANEELYGFCGYGAAECGFNPNSYDHAAALGSKCQQDGTDRPWIAYGHNRLLLVNNGFVGNDSKNVAQVGIADPATGIADWNMCAGEGYIPGVPAMRDSDGRIAVPQLSGDYDSNGNFKPDRFTVLEGSTPQTVRPDPVWKVKSPSLACDVPNWGFSSYSQAGTLFATSAIDQTKAVVGAQFGDQWKTLTVNAPGPIEFLWVSASQIDDGALVTYAVTPRNSDGSPDCSTADFYAAHVVAKGKSIHLADTSLVAAKQDSPCGDYHGSSLGPDGRAYVAVETGGCLGVPGSKTLSVWIQRSGPTE